MSDRNKVDLISIARQTMIDKGFFVEFPAKVVKEAQDAQSPDFSSLDIRDLSELLWSSIDNDDSKDLDQLEYFEETPQGGKIFVAIADVSSHIASGSATDRYARHNTTSVYTGIITFPMLPLRFSTDLTSLNENQKRRAIVVEMDVKSDGTVMNSSVYQAVVKNKAQLTYEAVNLWLEKTQPPYSPITESIFKKINSNKELQKQIINQDAFAQSLRSRRHRAGALDFRTIELRPTFTQGGSIELSSHESNRATQIIEEFMIASNESVEKFLESKNYPCFQRIVREPKNWPRMVTLAALHGGELPEVPDGKALQKFLAVQQATNPDQFPDLSLAMIKLMGRGEYVVKSVGDEGLGHFGLAASNYAHTTAPNRRYPDLITQRLLKSIFEGSKIPYTESELEEFASHCTLKEDDANHVERKVKKCIAAVALSRRIGEEFDGIITGVTDKGVFVRIAGPSVEGKIDGDTRGVEVGDHVTVRLTHTDPYRGFIDFQITEFGNR